MLQHCLIRSESHDPKAQERNIFYCDSVRESGRHLANLLKLSAYIGFIFNQYRL